MNTEIEIMRPENPSVLWVLIPGKTITKRRSHEIEILETHEINVLWV
jgi:hypothetical protein